MNCFERFKSVLLGVFLVVATTTALQAQDAGGLLEALSTELQGSDGSGETASMSGRIIQVFALMTVLSVAPGIIIVATSFTRFVIVFSMLRSALGLNQTPPNMVIISLSLFMSFFVMQPVMEKSWNEGLSPLLEQEISEEEAIGRITDPFKEFMFANTRDKDLDLFLDIAEVPPETEMTVENTPWRSMVPAFLISELRKAFTIGFLLYLPFLAIDLVVASVLMSAGMMMLPPIMISLPFKVIFFVLVDGWHQLAGSLIESFVPV